MDTPKYLNSAYKPLTLLRDHAENNSKFGFPKQNRESNCASLLSVRSIAGKEERNRPKYWMFLCILGLTPN